MFRPYLNSGCATGTRALSLVEVLVAALILTIVVAGGVAFATSGRKRVLLSGQERTAAKIAIERIERARAQDYDSVDYDYGVITLDGTPYEWSLYAFQTTADPGDSDSVYKEIEVHVTWPGSGNDAVVLHSAISP